MHSNPDIVVATPGRLVHLGVEMGLKLEAVQYVVFDEADRLFEMGKITKLNNQSQLSCGIFGYDFFGSISRTCGFCNRASNVCQNQSGMKSFTLRALFGKDI